MTARILVVDDVEANRKLLEAKLGHEYFEVVLAKNGQEALDIIKRESIAIVLLDVMMPGIDGYEVCERIKSDPATSHIPVVMVTALADQEHRIRGLQAGAEDFLTKPINDFALLSRMRALMRFNRVVNELQRREAKGVGVFDSIRHSDLDKPARVFVVDDNERRASRLKRMLGDHHHVVTMQEANAKGGNDPSTFEVILLSLASQSFDPLRMCAAFLNNDATFGCALLAIADEGEQRRAVKALDLGASDIITSPVDQEELLARVRTQTRRARYLDILRKRVDRGLELAVKDQLTGLNNRRFMTNQLANLVKRSAHGGGPLSVVILDLDHFKRINDCFGHGAGDEVLRELADRLQLNVRPADLACRYGGEEFVIILPDTDGDLACSVAERVRASIAADPFVLPHGETIQVTASIGVATMTGNESPAELLERADKALYTAKKSGRNRVESVAA